MQTSGKRIAIQMPVVYSSPRFGNCEQSVRESVVNMGDVDPEIHSNGFWSYQGVGHIFGYIKHDVN